VTEFLETWAPRVYRFALRLTRDIHAAEDLAQEALLRAWSRRRQLREPRAAHVWLFRITANLWRDQLRRAGPEREALVRDPIGQTPPPERHFSQQEELRLALAALDALPSRQREVLYLNACEDLSLLEIAHVLDITPQAAKASLSLARKKLRQQLPTVYPI
jgi:RNA polymerase sigma-70 factor (ECF subfamily)